MACIVIMKWYCCQSLHVTLCLYSVSGSFGDGSFHTLHNLIYPCVYILTKQLHSIMYKNAETTYSIYDQEELKCLPDF